MKSNRLPLVLLFLLFICFTAQLWMDAGRLPNMVATHFDVSGRANDFMTRTTHLKTLGFFGFVVPLAELGLFYCMRFFRAERINIPNRHYWLAPERREETLAFFMRHGIWLSCMTLVFFGLIEWTLVSANITKPPHLATAMIVAPTVGFLLCIAVWIVLLLLRFSKIK